MSADGQSPDLSSPWTILLVEDDPVVAGATDILFRLAGHRLDIAADPQAAYSLLARRRYDAILLDMNFTAGRTNGEEGLSCIARIMAEDPDARIIVITAHSGIRIAVAAMQAGARDFLMKPWRKDDLLAKCTAAIGARGPAASPSVDRSGGGLLLLGNSVAMESMRATIRRVGPTVANICVTGRSGSGRTLAALAVHTASREADRPPQRIDLRDPDQWPSLDGAHGTLLLRHPERLDAVAQARLLDRLSPGLRCISVADGLGSLTPALHRRLCTLEIAVPPLQARRDDAVVLARHFAQVAAEAYGHASVRLTPAAEAVLAATDWPDEVRGLAAAVERAVLLSDDGVIDAAALRPVGPLSPSVATDAAPAFRLEDAERSMIEAALKEHRHNISRAASALGISRGTLYRRMAQHGL
ncbi:DNA-binding NtrC family response regulator [Sphingomonas sp. SORGH_AS 950]|uniref:sigma-54-dependent transcriptional regulator n=1 Tax=Sphingomonas sp. SORGH_AS_0950 TaxID=3041792 RepID=UPI002781772B|nr:response regulator [Sphingomonas sp. SORGH_AS_0950]MDQ1155680.1 DNA-binding NtrC family response regulator [Sphingomonas sp. SORGH_AS_0950]